MPDRAAVDNIATLARRHASISELDAAIRLLRYSGRKGGLSQPHTERLLRCVWELEEIAREAKGEQDA